MADMSWSTLNCAATAPVAAPTPWWVWLALAVGVWLVVKDNNKGGHRA
jgi:hypothetical protein